MRSSIGWGFVAAAIIAGFLARDNAFMLSVSIGLAGILVGSETRESLAHGLSLFAPLVLATTLFANRDVRVSIAYLLSIPIDGTQLLIRGKRITTQFQPVGGVFKVRFDETELMSRFGARPDTRFQPDAESNRDLRVRLKGRHLARLLRWFDKGIDREFMPVREFYEELIVPGLLNRDDFVYFDCSYVGRRTFGLEYDQYSGCQQLIICELYHVHLNETQYARLREVKERLGNDTSGELYFASPEEILRGGSIAGTQAVFEIARTARWLGAPPR